jgi:hypothetical protein
VRQREGSSLRSQSFRFKMLFDSLPSPCCRTWVITPRYSPLTQSQIITGNAGSMLLTLDIALRAGHCDCATKGIYRRFRVWLGEESPAAQQSCVVGRYLLGKGWVGREQRGNRSSRSHHEFSKVSRGAGTPCVKLI